MVKQTKSEVRWGWWLPLVLLAGIAAAVLSYSGSDGLPMRRMTFALIGPQLSETVVMVQCLPDVPELRGPTGHHLDLGYYFKADGSGEWVGYHEPGRSRSSYVMLRADQFSGMLERAGLRNLPAIPQRPADPSAWLCCGG
jgi:hypothetical protein